MTQPLYISAACSISAQHTYDEENFLAPVLSSGNGRLMVIDPDYSRYISPVPIRRMSRLLKRGITAGMKCLEDAGVKTPDAIIIGTARGSVTDMEHFLKDMIEMNEEALNPTYFIQSTYNSVNGWLAMMTKCTSYNQTFVHRGFSLELPLLDAQLFLAESKDTRNILVGGFEEMTAEYYSIRSKIGYYKDKMPDSLSLLDHSETPGSIGGEGAHFFTVSNVPGNAFCAIHSIAMLQQPSAEILLSSVNDMLAKNGLTGDDIDILVSGMNGDSRFTFLTDPLIAQTSGNTTIVTFKHLCGEYDTASGFGLWLANYLFTHKTIPSKLLFKQGTSKSIKNVLVYNVTITGNVSLMLLKGCSSSYDG